MTFTLNQLLAMAGRTVKNPREGASEVLALGIPREALWTIVALVVVISVILAEATVFVAGMRAGIAEGSAQIGPFGGAAILLALLIAMAAAVHLVGRAMGGKGSFPEAVLLIAWMQFILDCVQVLQILALLILPSVAGILFIVGVALSLWLLTNFVAVLHGFRSLAQVFVMILVTTFAIAFFLSLALTFLGVAVPIQTGNI